MSYAQIARRVNLSQAVRLVLSGKSAADFRTSRTDQEGRFAIVTNVGRGMRWPIGFAARERDPEKRVAVFRSDHAQLMRADEQIRQDGEVVWSWHPGADAKFAMFVDEHCG